MKKRLITILLCLISLSSAWAQNKTVKGTVIDEQTGEAIVGATVRAKGTKLGSITNHLGQFEFSVPDSITTLLITYVGMEPIEVEAKSNLKVSCRCDNRYIDDVVVVAYGQQRRRDLTAAVSSVKAEELSKTPATSLEQALQGKAAGVSISQATGAPGGAIVVNIRGVSSHTAGSEPLYVVDGLPIISQDITNASGYQMNKMSGIADINPSDIETIEVLKDASAAALYGSRASNGVILITTKKGRSQKTKVSLNSYVGWQDIPNQIEYLGTNEYIGARNEAIDNYNNQFGLTAGNGALEHVTAHEDVSTNWFDAITRKALQTSHQLSLNGGNDRTQFYISGGILLQDGVEKETSYKRYNLRSNIGHSINKKLRVESNIAFSYSDTYRQTGDGNIYGPWYNAKQIAPDYAVYDKNGDYNTLPNSWRNPLKLLETEKNNSKKYRAIIGLKGSWEIIPGLYYRINLGGDYAFGHEVNDWPIESYQGESVNGEVEDNRSYVFNHLIENTLDYKHTWGKLNLGALVGYSYQKRSIDNARIDSYNFLSSSLKQASSAGAYYSPSTSLTESALQSVFGRVNIIYDNKYLLEASLRGDASSKFAKGNRTGIFPAVSAGWRIANEKWFNNSIVSDLKLRGSVGATGNQEGIGAYDYQQTYTASSVKYEGNPGLSFNSSLANKDLKWEKTIQYGVGVDFALWDGRLEGTIEWYKKDTKDLLLSHSINGLSGYSSTTSNVGSLTNDGWEFSLTSNNINKKDFKWSTTFNLTYSHNKVTSLAKDANGDDVSMNVGYCNRLEVGEAYSSFYLIKQVGIFQTDDEVKNEFPKLYNQGIRAGDVKYEDLNGDGIITTDDRQIVGTPFPKVYGSLINNINYKGIDLTIDLQYSLGNKVYAYWKQGTNGAGNLGGNSSGYAILKSDWDNRWTGEGTSNSVPRAIYNGSGLQAYSNNTMNYTTRFLEDADFLRIRNITLGYTLPEKLVQKAKIQGLRVYGTINNLFNFTKYDGFDPEVVVNPTVAYYRGADLGSVPQSRSFVFGLNINF